MLNTKEINKIGLMMIEGFIEANSSSDRKLILMALDKLIRLRAGFVSIDLSNDRVYHITKSGSVMKLNKEGSNINFVADVRITKSIMTQLTKLNEVCKEINLNGANSLIESLANT